MYSTQKSWLTELQDRRPTEALVKGETLCQYRPGEK